MRKIILFLAIILAASTYAQRKTPQVRRYEMNPEQTALIQTQRLQEVLQLDSIQFQAIFLMNYSDAMAMQDSMKARQERRKDGKKDNVRPNEEERRVRREIMKKRMDARNEQMKQILTPEQYEKYLEHNEKIVKSGRPLGRQRR